MFFDTMSRHLFRNQADHYQHVRKNLRSATGYDSHDVFICLHLSFGMMVDQPGVVGRYNGTV